MLDRRLSQLIAVARQIILKLGKTTLGSGNQVESGGIHGNFKGLLISLSHLDVAEDLTGKVDSSKGIDLSLIDVSGDIFSHNCEKPVNKLNGVHFVKSFIEIFLTIVITIFGTFF